MTAKDHMRQKLDELMGTGWDGVKNSLHYSDPKVCRCFLLGLCPHDALAGTKMSMGACSKIHNYALKADFENSSRLYRQGQHRFYELTVLTYLQKVIRSCEILDRAKKGRLTRCQTTARNNRHGDKEATLKSYNDLVDKKLVEAEDLGNQGKVDDAIKVIKEVERLKRRRNRLERLLDRKSNEPVKEQKQNICEECQLCIGLDDNEQRIANHASGRLHNAILDMRRKIAELAASLEKSQMPGDWSRLDVAQQQTKQSTSRLDLASTRAHSYSPRSHRSSSRSSRRSRSRSRSSRRSRSRSSRKSYSSNYSRSSGECSSSSRSRSRSRSRSKHRRRSRKSHSKSRSRSSRRGSSRSCSRSRYSSSSSRSYSSSCSRSRNRSRSCSCCSWCSDRSRGQAKHRSRSRSRSRSQSKHRRGRHRRSRDRERRSRTPRKSKTSKQSPDKREGKAVSERSQVPDKEPKESSTKDDSKWSRKKEAESEEMKTQKDHCPPSQEANEREAKKHTLTEKDVSNADVSALLSSKNDSLKADCSSTVGARGRAAAGGPTPKDGNSDVTDTPLSPHSDGELSKLKRRLAKSRCTAKGEKTNKMEASLSPQTNHTIGKEETEDYVNEGNQPSEKKKAREKTGVVTAPQDWKTIKKPVINIANIRYFRMAHGNKKGPHKEEAEVKPAAGKKATKSPASNPPANVDSSSTKGQTETSENEATGSSAPVHEVSESGTTDSQQPSKPTGDKEGCTRELSEGEISCETESEQANSAHESPSKNLEEPEVVTKKKRRKGMKAKKKHESPRGRYSQTEDSGDESCSESSTYYQLVKRPKKKAAKIRKHSLKKTKVETARMSRKAHGRKSKRRHQTPSASEEDEDSESSTSYESPPAKRTKTKKSKRKTRRSPAAKRESSRKSSTASTKAKHASKKKSAAGGKKGSKTSRSARASVKTKSKRKLSSDSDSSSSSSSDYQERRSRRKAKLVKKSKKVKRKK